MGFLGALLGSALISGVSSLFGLGKSKTKTSSTTDPFYAMMSPYAIGQVLNRFGALQGAGFPQGAMNFGGSNMIGGDIWKTILQQWPKIKSGLKV